MNKFFLLIFSVSSLFASFEDLHSFDADFIQKITDEKEKSLQYSGHVYALKPQNVLWEYKKPIEKSVYINSFNVMIVEPELEQAIVKRLDTNFDFFKIIKSAQKINVNYYETVYNNVVFKIYIKNDLISSILYKDEFDNNVEILFLHQKYNAKINKKLFFPILPSYFDIIKD